MFLDYLSIKLMIFSRVSSLLEQSTILFHALSRMKAAALTLTSPMSAILIFGLCSGELWSWLVRIISMMLSRLAALQSQWGCENWVGGETYLEPWPVPACSPRSVWSCWRRSPELGLRRTRTAASCLSPVSPSNLRSKIYHHLSSISFVDGGLENSCTLYYLSMLFCHLSGRCHNIHQKILPITFNLVLHFGFFLFFLGSLNRLRFIFFHHVSQILCLNFKILNQSLQLRNFFTFFPNIFFSL